jgi:hypothetical protein
MAQTHSSLFGNFLFSCSISFWKLLILGFGAEVSIGLGTRVEAAGLEK